MRLSFLVSILFALASLSAQVAPTTQGLFLNADLVAGSVAYNDDDVDNAGYGGLNLAVGYGFTPVFTLYAQFSGGRVGGEDRSLFTEDYGLGIFEIMARFHFGKQQKRTVFYLEGGLQGFAATVSEDPDVEISGGGLVLTPGLLVYLSDRFALDFNLALAGGNVSDIEFGNVTLDISDDDLSYAISRLSVGGVFYLGK